MVGRKIGLAMGINNYSDPKLSNLHFAKKDAEEMRAVLLNPDIGGFNEIIPLVNETKYNVKKGIEKLLLKDATSDDLVLIYFSGHGKLNSKLELDLLLKDTETDYLPSTALHYNFITDCIEESKCKKVVIILDCCHSGAAGIKGEVFVKPLSETSGSGTFVLSATTGLNLAKEVPELENGIFTHFLLEGLRKGNADLGGDGLIDILELYEYASKKCNDEYSQVTTIKSKFEERIVIGKNPSKCNEKEEPKGSHKHIKEPILEGKKLLFFGLVLGILLIGTSYILISNSDSENPPQTNNFTQLNSSNMSKPFTQDTNIQKSYFQPIEYVSSDWENQLYYYIIFGKERYVPLKSDSKTKLAKFVLDNDDKYTIKTGETVSLGQGYTIKAKYVDVKAKEVWLEFSKGGKYIADKIISVDDDSGSTWEVRRNGIQGEDDVLVFRIHVNQIFQGAIEGIAQIDGIWLIDFEDAFTVKPGDKVGGYEIMEIADDYVSYKLPDSHTL